MVKPREAFLGAITELDEDRGGTVNANNAIITNVSAVRYTGRASAPTTGDGYGAFWVDTTSPQNRPVFTCNDGTVLYLGTASDHGGLTGLSDDDHTQYLLINGSRAMAGGLNMGGYNITNVNTVDGVDISAHNARHINGGTDIIDGDRLDISYTPTHYARTVHGSYTANYFQLTSHLYGIDNQLAIITDSIADIDGVSSSLVLTAGAGLSGGGDLSTDRTFDIVSADGTIIVNADSIQVGVITDINHGSLGGDSLHALATTTTAGFMSASDKLSLEAIDLDGYALSTHNSSHENGGLDEIDVTGLSGVLSEAQLITIKRNDSVIGTRSSINFIEGANVALTISDDPASNEIDVRISSVGGAEGVSGTLSQILNNGNSTDGYDILINSGDNISGSGTPISIVDGLNLNNYNITNVGLVDGYNLEVQFYTLTNTSADLISHISNTSNPHNTTIANIGAGTLAQLNAAISDADVTPTTRSIISGNGLTGGGDLSTDRTIAVAAADTTITVNADSIQVGVITDTNHGTRGGGTLHSVATTSVAGFESAADKTKLDGISAGAEVNPNIWSVFSDGTTTASPGSKTDSFRFRSANSILTTTIGSNNVTYGDNLLLTINQSNIDHGSISGLTDDDHTQYLLTSGSRAMTGQLNLGDFSITNCSSIGLGALTYKSFSTDHQETIIDNTVYELEYASAVVERNRTYYFLGYLDIPTTTVLSFTNYGRKMLLTRNDSTGTIMYQTQINYI